MLSNFYTGSPSTNNHRIFRPLNTNQIKTVKLPPISKEIE